MSECPLCALPPEAYVWRGRHFALLNVSDDVFPCYFRLIAREHVREVTDLSREVRAQMWKLLEALEEAMRAEMRCDKVNWAQFSNMVPHVHWHLTARWADDDRFPACPWEPVRREVPEALIRERREASARLARKLPEILSAVDQSN